MYGASADYCRDTMPNYLLQWEMIRYSVELGLRMYDLRGVPASPDPEDPLYGLYRFKKGVRGQSGRIPRFVLPHTQSIDLLAVQYDLYPF